MWVRSSSCIKRNHEFRFRLDIIAQISRIHIVSISPLCMNDDGIILLSILVFLEDKPFFGVSCMERRLRPNEGSDLPDCAGQYAYKQIKYFHEVKCCLRINPTGWHPSLQDRTVASKTKKFDSGILNALNLASRVSPDRSLSNSGKTNGSTGHLHKSNRGIFNSFVFIAYPNLSISCILLPEYGSLATTLVANMSVIWL